MEITNEFCHAVIQNMLDAFAFHRIITDEADNPVDYEFIEVNHTFEKFTGLKSSHVIGKRITEIVPNIADDGVNWIQFYGQVALTGIPATIIQYSEHFKKWYNVHAYCTEKGYFISIFNDVTDLVNKEKQLEEQNYKLKLLYEEQTALYEEQTALYEELTGSEEELKDNYGKLLESMSMLEKSEAIYRLVSDSSTGGTWYYDAKLDKTIFSERWLQLTGYTAEQMAEFKNWHAMIHPDDREASNQQYVDHFEGKTPSYTCEYRLKCADGTYKWFCSTGKIEYDNKGNLLYLAGSHTNIDELKQKNDKIRFLAYHDILTELPNRNSFMDILGEEIKSEGMESRFAVIIMDIDNFKDVNESIGHSYGDELIRLVGRKICDVTAAGNIISRFGGDEFAILLRRTRSRTETARYCEAVKKTMAEAFEVEAFNFNITGSFGVAMFPSDGTTTEELLKNAETAMYKAKITGRNHYQFFEPDMKEQVQKKLRVERKLRKAMNEETLYLCFQPQVELSTGKIRSFEALLRWYDEELGQIPPAEFIPIAEETGMIIQMGEWVLREACSRALEWNLIFSSELMVSVNISAVQLKQRDFLEMIKRILLETGLKPSLLELELTESNMINSIESTISIFNELKEMGVKLSMDDFGTGYSSLSYLKMLPLNSLKIDQSFIRDIVSESFEKEITGDIVSLVHKLNMEVIAEGVETVAQLDYLQKCNCDNVQGYLLGKPVRAEEIARVMNSDFSTLIF